jgi:hypothetical protein
MDAAFGGSVDVPNDCTIITESEIVGQEKKLFRVDYMYAEPDGEDGANILFDVLFVGGYDEADVSSNFEYAEFAVREATLEETEAYVRGFEDGCGTATNESENLR